MAGILAPVLSYVLQPRPCFEHLFLPYVLPVVVLLCLACAAAQSFIQWPPALQIMLAVVFSVSIQAMSLVPCLSSLEESQRVVRLVTLSLCMTWFAAAVLAAIAAELCRPGKFRVPRVVASAGFAVSGLSLALGATKAYLGTIGFRIWGDAFVALAEARMPVWLMVGVGVAVFGTAAALVQRSYAGSRGATV
jgi:hypothetical protein